MERRQRAAEVLSHDRGWHGVRRFVSPALWSIAAAIVWIVLASNNPTLTYHFAPAIVAAAWPLVQEASERRDAAVAGVGALAIALGATIALAIADSLRGPDLVGGHAATAESVVFAVAGAALATAYRLARTPVRPKLRITDPELAIHATYRGSMNRWTIVVALTAIIASCGSNSASEEPGFSAEAAFADGVTTLGQIEIDGVLVDYVSVVPDGFRRGDTAPVLFAFPPGGQDIGTTEAVTDSVYRSEAVARGWVVISPAAPGGTLFFNGSETLVPGLVQWMKTWVTPEGDAPHLAGVSNGGISAFRAAGANPELFTSVLVFPGFPRSEEDQENLEKLGDIPVRMFVGENDTGWVAPMQETLASLNELGADASLEVVPNEGHVISTLSDGTTIFDELDSLR